MKLVNFTPGEYLVGNLLLVTLIVASYIFVRKGSHPPVSLNLKRAPPPVPKTVHNPSRVEYRPRNAPGGAHEAPRPQPILEKDDFESSSQAKDLNVLFQWNGHTWDAFEVLGIPAGSSVNSARSAHDRLMGKVDRESRPFIAAALAAISGRTGT